MITSNTPSRTVRCAVYTRKSTEEGLEQSFNTLDAQRESAENYIAAQQHEGWRCLPDRYDDGGFTGGNMERPALKRMMADIEAGRVDCVVVYKVDRLSRSLLDFARMMGIFEKHGVSFVSVTQQFNTADSMGRLMLNVLLSFAQFEREINSERTRDKIAAARRKGKWSGGRPLLGYDVERTSGGPKLIVNEDEAARVRQIFELYLDEGSLLSAVRVLNDRGWRTKRWVTKRGRVMGDRPFDKGSLFQLLTNVVCLGRVTYKTEVHEGEHEAIVPEDLWQKVQARLRRNGHSGGREARNKHGALLKGLLYCSSCGCAMSHSYTVKGAKRYRYYVCGKAQKNGWHTCPSKSAPAGEIERFVIDQIRCIGRDPDLVTETIEQVQQQSRERTEELRVEERVIARELRRHHAALEDAREPGHLAELHERIGEAEQRLTCIRDELASIEAETISEEDVRAALADFDVVWAALSPKEQRRIIQLLVERVEYDGQMSTVSITFHPTGIKALAGQMAGDHEVAA
jgi:site-specific DNA recombinase